jgi:hypothetical protein
MFYLRPFILIVIGLVASDGSYKPGAGCQNSVKGPFMCQIETQQNLMNYMLKKLARWRHHISDILLLLLTVVAIFMQKFVVQPLLRNGYILC